VFRNLLRPVFALTLFSGGLLLHAAMAQAAPASPPANVDLSATFAQQGARAAQSRQFNTQAQCVTVQLSHSGSETASDKLFVDVPPKEGGWKGLARLLEALTPSVDTAIPLTASQITGRITSMLNSGENQAALDAIEKRIRQREAQGEIGSDVQLMFLHGRALAALGRNDEAIKVYLDMTTRYPELPEPWNNLAAEYTRQGLLDLAYDALNMALTANPDYPAAQANLGRVQLMLAQQSFERAATLGVASAKTEAEQTRSILRK